MRVLRKTPDKLALMERLSGVRFERKNSVPQGWLKISREVILENLQPPPFDKLRAGSPGLNLEMEFLHAI